MSQKLGKDVTLKIDNAAGALTDITTYVTSSALEAAADILDTTGYGATTKTATTGLASSKIPLAGLLNGTTEAIFGPLMGVRTSILKTIQYGDGNKFHYGECNISNVKKSGSPADLLVWSADAEISGACTRTSVTQA